MSKIVLLIGSEYAQEDIELIKKSISSSEVQIIADGKKKISELDLNILKNKTDEDTIFVILSHGGNRSGSHVIDRSDRIITMDYLRKIQTTVGHPISVYLDSCQSGVVLKNKTTDKNISLLTSTGSKYKSPIFRFVKTFQNLVKLKLSGASNKEVFKGIIISNPESLYYSPANDEKKEGDESAIKFARPGKFTIDEISDILKSVLGEEKAQEIKKKFDDTKKSDFSIYKIKQILDIDDSVADEKKQPSLSEESTLLLKKFRAGLKNKLTKDNIKLFLEDRKRKLSIDDTKSESKKQDIADQKADDLFKDFWFIANNRGYSEEIKAMVENEPDIVNQVNIKGYTSLIFSALEGYDKNINQLRQFRGIDVNKKTPEGLTALMVAVKRGNIKSISELKKFDKIDVNHTIITGDTALTIAAAKGNIKVINELQKFDGIDVNHTTIDGYTALMIAAAKGQIEVAKALIEAGATGIDKALEIAKNIRNPKPEMINFLESALEFESIYNQAISSKTTRPIVSKNLDLKDIESVTAMVTGKVLVADKKHDEKKETKEQKEVRSLVLNSLKTRPDQKLRPLGSVLMLHVKGKEAVKYLNENLDLLMPKPILFRKDYKGRLPFSVVIERAMSEKKADVREEFIKIAKKMAGEMNLKNDEYREYCLNKKGEKYKSKSEIKKLDDILGKVLTEIKEDDFTNDLYKKGITASSLVGDSKTRNRG